MNQQSFLIIHGLGGSGPDHWQSWLDQELRERKLNVCYPTFSDFDSPDKNVWLNELSSAIDTIPKDHYLTVITHSLGCLLWLHFAAAQNKQIANQVILVAPPAPTKVLSEAKSFFPVPLNGKDLSIVAEETLFVHSTNDPYCSIEDTIHYTKLNIPSISLANAGHINTQSGFGKWPWILDLCLKKNEKSKVYL
ncbi:MAG: RBBP9/YdeN family alpha/beta hydrolase [Neobacillus sp.]